MILAQLFVAIFIKKFVEFGYKNNVMIIRQNLKVLSTLVFWYNARLHFKVIKYQYITNTPLKEVLQEVFSLTLYWLSSSIF